MMAEIDENEKLSDALASFGALIRYNINHGQSTLGLELEHAKDYICILNLLKNDSLSLRHNIKPSMSEIALPMLVLQPLVENAILHGYDGVNPLFVFIDCKVCDAHMTIKVTNNGKTIERKKLDEINIKLNQAMKFQSKESGIALTNIHNRLRMQYGEKYGLTINNDEDGVTVAVNIPLYVKKIY